MGFEKVGKERKREEIDLKIIRQEMQENLRDLITNSHQSPFFN